jgi:hypothetical chaperone protein
MNSRNSALAYGIDFGTSNSTISVARNVGIETLAIDGDATSPEIMRSILYFDPTENKVFFGEDAIQGYLNDIALGRSSEKKQIFTGKYIKVDKPIIGDSGYAGTEMIPEIIEIEIGDAGRLVQSVKSGLGVSYVKSLNIFDKVYKLEEVAGLLLKEIKERADRAVGEDVRSAVIGTPVNFVGGDNKLAISRLEKAAKIAGFKDVIFEYEPLGAARSYSINKSSEEVCLVFDFGGGTLDFSIVEFPGQKVLMNDGLPIGGDALDSSIFDEKLLKYFGGDAKFGDNNLPLPNSISSNLKHWYLISLLKTKVFLNTIEDLKAKCDKPETMDYLHSLVNYNLGFSLYEEIDRAKVSLSSIDTEKLHFSQKNIYVDDEFTRADFEKIISNDLNNIEIKINEMLRTVGLEEDDITTVITTGGSSLIPAVQSLLMRKFRSSKLDSENVFTSVSYGLAKKAGVEFGKI